MGVEEFDPDSLSEVLPLYYNRLFPFDSFYRWLSYGNVDSRHFSNREFSFTLHDDIYIRYQSYNSQSEMEEAIKKRCPFKIDIGAVFNYPPNRHRQMASSMLPVARELVFDIDLTDYDDIRNCCQGAAVCTKCWKFMALACKILDVALRDDFGFKNLLWVFSGRRGIHCWVCDVSVRILSTAERSAVAEYLQLISGSSNYTKKVILPSSEKLHPSIRRAVDIISNKFVEVCIEGQGILRTPSSFKKVLALIPDESIKKGILNRISESLSDKEKWAVIQEEIAHKSTKNTWLLEEIMLQYAYPRLDINVTKGLNHLLKSPFCIHPKTGKICTPFNPKTVDKFNPTLVPTITQLIQEVNSYDAEAKKHLNNEEMNQHKGEEYKKTSMSKSVQVFEDFVRRLEDSLRKKNGNFDFEV